MKVAIQMMNMNNQTLVDIIFKEIKDYEGVSVNITDKVTFNQHETIKKIVQHQNNGFTKASSKKRFFYNIGNSRVDTAIKKIDYDRKDVAIEVDGEDTQGEQLLLQAEMQQYLLNTKQGFKFNDIVEQFPDGGNVIVKETDDDNLWEIVNPIHFKVVDITVKDIEDTTVVEEHIYNAQELRAKSDVWDNVDVALETCNSRDGEESPQYYVYERYGEMSLNSFKEAKGEEKVDGGDDTYIQTMGIVAIKRPNNKFYISEMGETTGVLMFLEELKGKKGKDGQLRFKPYKTLHWDAYKGRFWRKGIREVLIPYQDRINILSNQIYEAMKWSQVHVLWSNDQTLAGRNIFKAIENGQIIKASDLNILPLEERNLTAQVNEWNRLNELMDKETQSFEVATGERLPSGTTLGAVEIQTSTVGQYFQYKREKLGLFLEDIFNDWVLPKLIEQLNKEHILEITGDTKYMDDYFNMIAKGIVVKNIHLLGMGADHKKAIEMVKQQIQQSPKQKIKVLKDTYKGLKMRARVVISGESLNRQNKVNNGLALLNIISNPEAMQNPQTADIVKELAKIVGYRVSDAQPQMAQPQATPQIKTDANLQVDNQDGLQ